MPIIAKSSGGGDWPVAPEGLWAAVCVDVWDPWMEENKFTPGSMVAKTRIVWIIDELDEKGKPYEVSQLYTLSLHPKANLSRHLESWRGKPFTEADREGFDIERLIGVNCQLQVTRRLSSTGKTFANVGAIVPPAKGQAKLAVPADYVRHKDKGDKRGSAPVDDEVPF